jgi:hypothetical protein
MKSSNASVSSCISFTKDNSVQHLHTLSYCSAFPLSTYCSKPPSTRLFLPPPIVQKFDIDDWKPVISEGLVIDYAELEAGVYLQRPSELPEGDSVPAPRKTYSAAGHGASRLFAGPIEAPQPILKSWRP